MKKIKCYNFLTILALIMGAVAIISCSNDAEDDSHNNADDNNNSFGANKIKAVDLGLSVKWANMNVGASKPEEYGDYFAWGMTKPMEYPPMKYFDYVYVDGRHDYFKKYNNDGGKTVLDLQDDAAHVNWGGAWRMPTYEEMDELYMKCEKTYTTLNGVEGFEMKSKINGNSIFLPYAGKWVMGISAPLEVKLGVYLTSELRPNNSISDYSQLVYGLLISYDYYGYKTKIAAEKRFDGHTIRAVCE